MILRIALLICLAFVSTAQAQIGTGAGECNIVWTSSPNGAEGGAVFIRVFGHWKGVRFSAPLPDCVDNAVINVEPLYGYAMTGNLEDGIEINFGDCVQTGDVLRIDFGPAPAQTLCCPYPIQPHPDYGQIQLIDCNDQIVVPAWTTTLNFTSPGYDGDCGVAFAFPAQDPVPVNGATAAPTSGDLQWAQYGYVGCTIFGTDRYDVYFGSTPDPPLVASLTPIEAGFPPHTNVGPLEPETTYYWRIDGTRDGKAFIQSPLWSFTTSGLVATKQTTWGGIKALYRN